MGNIAKNKNFPTWVDVLRMFGFYIAVQAIVVLIFLMLDVKAPLASTPAEGDASNITTFLSEQEALGAFNAWTYLLSMSVTILLYAVFLRLWSGQWWVNIKHSWAGFNPNVLLVGVLWLLSAQIILEPLVMMLPDSDSNLGLGLWAMVTVVVSAPILEEVLCRGLILESLRKRYSAGVSILISALFFGMIHLDPATIVVATVSGVILGVLYVRTSSIFASIIVHSINNAMAFTLINFEKEDVPFSQMVGEGTSYYIFYGVAVVIFIAASIEAYFKVFRVKKESVQISECEEVSEPEQVEIQDEVQSDE